MASLLFIYLQDHDEPITVSGGKISFGTVRKTFKDNQKCNPDNVVSKIKFKDRVVSVLDINMVTMNDPTEALPGRDRTKVNFTNDTSEIVALDKGEVEESMKYFDKDHLYESRFVDIPGAWTIIRKNRIKSLE